MTKMMLNHLTSENTRSRPYIPGKNQLSQIELAILKTVTYADVFDYPLNVDEIHRYLIEVPAEKGEIRNVLETSCLSTTYLGRRGDYYILRGREKLVPTRLRRAEFARKLWFSAEYYGRIIARMPFVRMVAVTGSLVMNNIEGRPDIDYLIAAEPGRVWLCRAGIIALVRWASKRNVILCPNYILSTNSLVITQRNLYSAHELAQMIPLSGRDVYDRMREANTWVKGYLPNAQGQPGSIIPTNETSRSWFGRAGELLLGSSPGGWLENWEMDRKIAKLKSQHPDQAESDFCSEWCKGHFENHGQKAIAAYKSRLDKWAYFENEETER